MSDIFKNKIKKILEYNIPGKEKKRNLCMDAFQRIAQEFKEDCIAKLRALEDIKLVVVSSETVGIAMRKLLIDPEIYPDGYSYIQTIQSEIDRFRRCIDSTEVKNQFSLTGRYFKYPYIMQKRILTSNAGNRTSRAQDIHDQFQSK